VRLLLTDIPPYGSRFSLDADKAWALRAAEVALEGPVAALSGALEVTRNRVAHADGLLVTGAVDAQVTRGCDRCSREGLSLRVSGPLELMYVPDLGADAGNTGAAVEELVGGELDLGLYADGALDLALVVQEHLALQLPPRITCDTPGVALPEAGQAACDESLFHPPPPEPDPRWAALRGLKLGAAQASAGGEHEN